MGLLDRFRKGKPQQVEVNVCELPAGALTQVSGESHYQDTLRQTAVGATRQPPREPDREIHFNDGDRPTRWFRAVLIPERDNKHDPNAVAVYSQFGKVGYLRRKEAAEFREVFDLLTSRGFQGGTCPAFLRGGDNAQPTIGAVLVLSKAWWCLDELADDDED